MSVLQSKPSTGSPRLLNKSSPLPWTLRLYMICFCQSLTHLTISPWLTLLQPKGFLAILQPRPHAATCGFPPAGILGLPCPPAVVLGVSAQESAPGAPFKIPTTLPPLTIADILYSTGLSVISPSHQRGKLCRQRPSFVACCLLSTHSAWHTAEVLGFVEHLTS